MTLNRKIQNEVQLNDNQDEDKILQLDKIQTIQKDVPLSKLNVTSFLNVDDQNNLKSKRISVYNEKVQEQIDSFNQRHNNIASKNASVNNMTPDHEKTIQDNHEKQKLSELNVEQNDLTKQDIMHNVDQPNMCQAFVRISLAVNIGVLIAVCTVLIAFGSSQPVIYCWGTPTASRGILLSIYFAILIVSILLLALHFCITNNTAIQYMVAALLTTQIIYKVSTPITITFMHESISATGGENPVAISNLCISVLHAITLQMLWRWHCSRKQYFNKSQEEQEVFRDNREKDKIQELQEQLARLMKANAEYQVHVENLLKSQKNNNNLDQKQQK